MVTRFGSGAGTFLVQSSLPATCAGCGVSGVWICEKCEVGLTPDPGPGCRRCGRLGRDRQTCSRCSSLYPVRLVRTRAGFLYDGAIRRAIQRFKYNGEYQRGRDLGERLTERVLQNRLVPSNRLDLIVPVPLHTRRYRARGFNQSSILATAISEECDVPVVEVVRRERNTTPQVRLRANERLGNLDDAFVIDDEMISDVVDKTVLLVDDVMTTGATLSAVALTLQRAGAARIHGLTLAREQ